MEGAATVLDACRGEAPLATALVAAASPATHTDQKIAAKTQNHLFSGARLDQGESWRAPRTSSSSSSGSSEDDGMGAASSSSMSLDAGKGPSSAEVARAAADVATAAFAAALLPSPPRGGACPPLLPPPSPVDAAALVLASAAAAATEQRQRRCRRRRHEARKQQQQQDRQQQQAASGRGGACAGAAPASSSSPRWCPRPLASLARAAPLLAAAALIGALVPALIAPGGSVVRQRWAPTTDAGAPPPSSSSSYAAAHPPLTVRLGSTVACVDAAAGALELAFSATVRGAADAVTPDGTALRLVVGVGAYAALEIDLPTEQEERGPPEARGRDGRRRHAFAARVPMVPSAAVAAARARAASYAIPSQLPFPFEEWSSVVQVWAALERCGGDSPPLSSLSPASSSSSSCSRSPVPLEWAASMSSRSWRARVSSTRVVVVGGPGALLAPSSSSSVAAAQLRVSLSRPAPARVLALLEMSARWLLGAYAALAIANWVVAALVLGPLLRCGHPRRGAFGATGAGGGVSGGVGGGGGGGSGAEEIFSTLD